MTENVIHFAAEYVDAISQQVIDQTPLDRKLFVQEVLAQLPWYIACKKFGR